MNNLISIEELQECRNLDELEKLASSRLGEVPRVEMPQVDAFRLKKTKDVPTAEEVISPHKLKRTQEEFNKTKVKSMANDWDNLTKKPVVISKDNWILDGHHRVEAAKKLGKFVKVIRVNLPGRTALNKLKELEVL